MTMEKVAGVDEAGRGPLAGPVIAAAVVLHPNHNIEGIDDSKVLSERKRESLFGEIKDRSLAWSIGRAEVEEIDHLNILQATLLAMQRAINNLPFMPDKALIDGTHCPKLACATESVVNGDKTISAIGAASILAKVTRDAEMVKLDELYPGYGFALHKGYPTKQHLQALSERGVTVIHRRSYAPVKKKLQEKLA